MVGVAHSIGRTRRSTSRPVSASPNDLLRSMPWAVGAGLFAGLLYCCTAARFPITGDNPEFLLAAESLGVPHAPGYPIVAMLGALFSHLPFSTPAFQVNMAAVACGVVAVGAVVVTGMRLGAQPLMAVAGAWFYAFNPLVWEYFNQIEVFPVVSMLVSLYCAIAVSWVHHPNTRLLLAASVVLGLAINAHANAVLLGPGALVVLYRQRTALVRRWYLVAVAAGLVVIAWGLPYGYVLWAGPRNPVVNWGFVTDLGDLVPLITREGYAQTPFSLDAVGSSGRRVMWMVTSLTLVGVLAALGLI